jgi:heterodisulfide reductase subunit C
MDYYPDRLIRLLQLGLKNEVLRSKTIWVCTACETCVTRCPNEIDIPKLMDYLKQMALEEGAAIYDRERDIAIIHRIFLEQVRKRGRIYELSLIGRFKQQTFNFFSDANLGWQMFKKKRLAVLPPRKIRGIYEIRKAFSKFTKT